jgi:diguanylate cyclase (GGDEF)-like protein
MDGIIKKTRATVGMESKNQFIRFADQRIPAEIRDNPDIYLRGHLLLALILFCLAACLITLPLGGHLFGYTSAESRIGLAINVFFFSGYLSAYYFLTRRSSFGLAAHITFGLVLTTHIIAMQLTGGFTESPATQLTLFTPLFAFVLIGIRYGLAWLGVTAALCIVSYLLSRNGTLSIQLLEQAEHRKFLDVLFFFLLMFMSTIALIFYDLMYQNLQRRLQEESDSYQYQANHDMLTRLPNRFQFFAYFEKVLESTSSGRKTLALSYIDLDGFKAINDTFGHHTGDAILKNVAQRLQAITRTDDMVARYGGDEFVLLLPTASDRQLVAKIVERIVKTLQQPIEVDGIKHRVTCSAGVAMYPKDGRTIDSLCRNADTALYTAKETNNTFCFYEDSKASSPKLTSL